MGLTLSERKAVTKANARRYRAASKTEKGRILDELCATTGWHRNHARKVLSSVLRPQVVRERKPRPPVYDESVIAALRFCWAVMGAPAGKRMAPFLPELVDRLPAASELDIDDDTAAKLCAMSAATIDRRLAADRAKLAPRGRSHTKPGSLLKDAIPVRTWAEWDDAAPGFVEIDLVGHDGGNASGEHAFTLTVTDIATGWTETRSVRNKAQKWVFAALEEIIEVFPFPIAGIDSDNGSEFINAHLLRYCEQQQITFTRSRPGNKNDGAHVEQKNWHVVRELVGYHRYDTAAELELLNQIWQIQVEADELLQPAAEADLQRTPRGEGDQALRHRRHSEPASPGTREGHQGPENGADQYIHHDQPGGCAASHPGTDRRTAHPHHRQSGPAPTTQYARIRI